VSLSRLVQVTLGLQKGHWPVKGLYFFFFAGVGLFFTFINVYYQSIGLSGMQIGLINAFGSLVGIFSTTLWGILNDRFGKTRLLFVVAVLGAILAVLGLSAARMFVWILPAACIFALFNSTFIPMMDSTTLSLLGDQRERYGTIRVWGTIGFIITSSTVGFIYERTGLHAMFIVYALVMGFFLVASIGLPSQPVRLRGSLLQGLSEMVRQPLWVLFAASVFLLWLANSGTMAFLSVAIKTMGGSERLIGLSWTIAAVTELPVMLFSASLLRKFGTTWLLFISFVGFSIRISLYAIMPSPNWVLVINVLNSVSFVPFQVGAVAYANEIAPEHLKATTQSLLFSIMGLSNMAGAMISGWLFDQIGPAGLFKTLAGICILALLLFGLGRLALNKR